MLITLTREEKLNAGILSYEEYRFIHGCKPSAIPSYTEFWEYFYWAKAHGFTPYGGEAKLDDKTIYHLNKKQIECELKAYQKEAQKWLDNMVES